ncbi:MAG: PhoU domain-containing protein [Candidatus Zixiibacteriota bacterium]
MFRFEKLDENIRFLLLHVKSQVEQSMDALDSPEEVNISRLQSRETYIDYLKNIIMKKSFGRILDLSGEDEPIVALMMSLNTIVNNLERIGDYTVNIISQTDHFKSFDTIKQFDYKRYYDKIFLAFEHIRPGLFKGDMDSALKICECEAIIDEYYKDDIGSVLHKLRENNPPEDLITTLFILRYLERLGDSLLNIGEAIISGLVGDKLRISQYVALKQVMDLEKNFMLKGIGGETSSGASIGKVIPEDEDAYQENKPETIFKEGKLTKLIEEKECLEMWHDIFPGLTPRVFGFEENSDYAIILIEFLKGLNFQEIVLGQDDKLLTKALSGIFQTLNSVWTKTKIKESANAKFIAQLEKRLDDVYRVHPSFELEHKSIGGKDVHNLEELIDESCNYDEILNSPYSVMIHGDFNCDNIIYNQELDRIYYIDVHRSKYMDYAQDISVFIMSNFRLPFVDNPLRDRINTVIQAFLEFSRDFANKNNDNTFDARLALGLVRSFITSTRFELNQEFADAMFLRGLYLLEKLKDFGPGKKPFEEFKLDENVVIY